jgi:hypothetical protein
MEIQMSSVEVLPKKLEQPKGGLAVSVSFASLVTAAVVGAINFQFLPKTAFWISAVGLGIVAVVFVSPWLKSLWAMLGNSRKARRIDHLYRVQVVALCRGLRPLSEQSSSYSVGSILNQLVNDKVLQAGHAHAYQIALSALYQKAEDLYAMESRLGVSDLMDRIYVWLQLYGRLCEGISSCISYNPIFNELHKGQWDSLQRSWNESRQRAVALCNEFRSVAHGMKVVDPNERIPEYLSPIPEIIR